ncbi:MAG: YceD family protein [Xanthomonadales bacterium]|nr:YceD family protein [Xanthomonadales bacterium]
MSREYPDWISPNRAAEGKRIFSGTIPLKRMKRLAALLVDAQGEASFTAAFRTDLEQQIVIDLQVEADLPLICQASLEVYDERVNRSSELVVVDDDSEQSKLPDNYEPVVTENGRLAIASLVEDELLLGLPQIPRKPGLQEVEYSTGGQTLKTEAPPEGSKKHPFSALQGMLKREK